MYETFFQLKQRPFAAAPRADRYFPAAAIEAARQTLSRSVERAEGTGLLIGPSGTGKTLLCHLLAEQFRGKFAVALLSNGHLNTRRELLQAILFELGLPYRRLEEGELRLSLIDYLSSERDGNQGLLLLLDEAHTFSIRLLEEVRLISNLVRNGQPRVRLVLSGGPSLEERFANPRLEAFSQRIASRCYLEKLDYTQTRQYVMAQLAAVGMGGQQLFTSDALDAIHRAADGVARLINQVCDHALTLAFAGGQRQIDAAGIDEAWADLQQLPAPWAEAGQATAAERDEGFIEFGGLDDDALEDGGTETGGSDDGVSRKEALGIGSQAFEISPPRGDRAGAAEATLLLHELDGHILALGEEFTPPATNTRHAVTARHATPPSGNAAAERSTNKPSPADPFGHFEEEEVVIDRYSSLDLAGIAAHAHVHSQEGRQLAALLAAGDERSESAAGPRLAVMPAAECDQPASGVKPAQHALGDTAPPLTTFSSDTVLASQVWDTASAITVSPVFAAEAVAVAGQPALAGVPSDSPSDEARVPESRWADHDMIVIEDDPTEIRPFKPARAGQVRRQEYRRLFSTLRRG
jgi:type II secretory pathway predicted ATPase ExeA